MESRTRGFLAVAAQARIEEIGGQVATRQASAANPGAKTADRAMWALGDYHRFAKETVWELGPVLVAACGISPGQRVLDVAAGTGNVAIRAAEAGARVVASDLTPENFEAGRREARERGVELDWVEADAEALPFRDGEFDVVTSSFGAIFAPDHRAVADELVRVCRPGGTIGLLTFTPEGLARDFFELFGRYGPPPAPGAQPPILWGSEAHVRELFADRLAEIRFSRDEYVERAPTPPAYVELFRSTFGPLIALRAFLADRPDGAAALDRDLLEFATRANSGAPGGPAEYHYEYLLVVGRTRGS
ncbi:MAG TPA: methyltransferase domain-containing protein [Gaiellaceae bacterium]|nr:methyltransferase domain-containing protein [Gaiellaceae bacterium]